MLLLLTMFHLGLTLTSNKLMPNCGRDKCTFQVNNRALMLAVKGKGDCTALKHSFVVQVLDAKRAKKTGATTPSILTEVETYYELEWDKGPLSSYMFYRRREQVFVMDNYGELELCQPFIGFQQEWVEGVLFKFRLPNATPTSWTHLLQAGMTTTGWKPNFKEDMIRELVKFRTFLKKADFATYDTQFIINSKGSNWKLYLIDIELHPKTETWRRLVPWNFREIEFFIKFLELYQNPIDLQEAIKFILRFRKGHLLELIPTNPGPTVGWIELERVIVEILFDKEVITNQSFEVNGSVKIKLTGEEEVEEEVVQVSYNFLPSDSADGNPSCVGLVYFYLTLIELAEVANLPILPKYSVCIDAQLEVKTEKFSSENSFAPSPRLQSAIDKKMATICFF